MWIHSQTFCDKRKIVRHDLALFYYGNSPVFVVTGSGLPTLAAKENYDISTSDLTGRRSASELLGNIRFLFIIK